LVARRDTDTFPLAIATLQCSTDPPSTRSNRTVPDALWSSGSWPRFASASKNSSVAPIDGFVLPVLLVVAIVRSSSSLDRSETLEQVLAERDGVRHLPPMRRYGGRHDCKHLNSKPRTRL